jgi:arylsulfatase A-like enzyme
VKLGWNLVGDAAQYVHSTADSNGYEAPFKWENAPVFPRHFDSLPEKSRLSLIKSIPAGNTLTFMLARACIEGAGLGKSKDPDFLAVSLSSPDYVGHRFGPNSMEVEDTYLRLDREIASFLKYLDRRFGRNRYLLFLTADHGGAHNPRFLRDHGVPAGVEPAEATAELNEAIRQAFGIDSLVVFTENYQLCLNEALFSRATADRETIRFSIMEWLRDMPQVAFVIDMEHPERTPVPEPLRTMVVNGYHRNRSGSIQVILKPGWYDNEGKYTGTTHGSWYGYDTHIPLLWYGWHVPKGHSVTPVHMTDIAPTLAEMLHIQGPNGSIGRPLPELTGK